MFSAEPLAIEFAKMKHNTDISNKEFADKCNLDYSRFSKIIRGKISPSMSELERICIGLNCTPNDIIELKEW